MDFTFPEKFEQAARYFDFYVGGDLLHTDKLDNERKLLFYALRMQAEQGPCRTPAPAFWHVTERYKHAAWSKLGNMNRFEAMVLFVKHFEEVLTSGQPHREIIWLEKIKELPEAAGSGAGAGRSPDLVPEEEWDDDLKAHRAATPENIAFLASQVMLARRRLAAAATTTAAEQQGAAGAAPRVTSPATASGGAGNSRPAASSSPRDSPASPYRPIYGPAIVRANGAGHHHPLMPPRRPEQEPHSGAAIRVPIAPPPKPCANGEASGEKPPTRLSPPIAAAADASKAATDAQQSSSGWGAWLGW